MLQFGSGKFNCIGQSIAKVEMMKLTAALMLRFDLELADPEKEWTLTKGSFVNVTGVDVRIRHRANQ